MKKWIVIVLVAVLVLGDYCNGAIGFVGNILWTAALTITGALVWFTNLCMQFLGRTVGRIPYLGPILIVLLVAGIIWVLYIIGGESKEDGKGQKKQSLEITDRIEMLPIPGAERIASFAEIYQIILYVMYYPCAFLTGLFWAVSGRGSDMAFFSGMLSGETAHTFSNYSQWYEAPKYICAIVIVKLAMKIVGSICQRNFKGLLRTLLFTINAATLGLLVGMVYIWMQEASEGNFILTVLFLIPSFAIYLIYPYIMLGLIMPLILITLPVLALIIIPLSMIIGPAAAGAGAGQLEGMKTDAFVEGDILTYEALTRAEQGNFGLLLFTDILNM